MYVEIPFWHITTVSIRKEIILEIENGNASSQYQARSIVPQSLVTYRVVVLREVGNSSRTRERTHTKFMFITKFRYDMLLEAVAGNCRERY
jgi:hypothetical protein